MRLFTFFTLFMFFSISCYAGSQSYEAELLKAASRGETSSVVNMLAKGARVDSRDALGNTPLILASDSGYQEIVRVLLDKRAAVNAMNKYGYTPLLSAVTNSHRYVASLLLSYGADPDVQNKYGTSARMYIQTKGFFTLNEYVAYDKPAMSAVIDDRKERRGGVALVHNRRWREHFNTLLTGGQNIAAADFLVLVANENNHEAQYLLGMLLVERNELIKGVNWLKKALTSKDPEVLYNIGRLMVSDNDGYDSRIGIEALQKAINEGSKLAEIEYARCLLFGIGTTRKFDEAYKIFEKYAVEKVPEAIFYQGYMMFNGQGVALDETEGVVKISEASKLNFELARKFLKSLDTEKLLKTIAVIAVADRPKLKAELISNNAPLVTGKSGCDTYELYDYAEYTYNLEKLEICYPGDGSAYARYKVSPYVEPDTLQYLKNISNGSEFIEEL